MKGGEGITERPGPWFCIPEKPFTCLKCLAFLDPSACVGHYSEPFISLLNVCNNPREKHYYYYSFCFIDNELEAQRVEATCPGLHNDQVGFTSLKYIASDRSLNPFEPWVSCVLFCFVFPMVDSEC